MGFSLTPLTQEVLGTGPNSRRPPLKRNRTHLDTSKPHYFALKFSYGLQAHRTTMGANIRAYRSYFSYFLGFCPTFVLLFGFCPTYPTFWDYSYFCPTCRLFTTFPTFWHFSYFWDLIFRLIPIFSTSPIIYTFILLFGIFSYFPSD